jgi:hypothetical protein
LSLSRFCFYVIVAFSCTQPLLSCLTYVVMVVLPSHSNRNYCHSHNTFDFGCCLIDVSLVLCWPQHCWFSNNHPEPEPKSTPDPTPTGLQPKLPPKPKAMANTNAVVHKVVGFFDHRFSSCIHEKLHEAATSLNLRIDGINGTDLTLFDYRGLASPRFRNCPIAPKPRSTTNKNLNRSGSSWLSRGTMSPCYFCCHSHQRIVLP